MNVCTLVGRLARAPLVRWEGEGVQTATATLIVSEPGKEKAYTLYVPLTFWGRVGEQASLLEANALISVQGKLAWKRTAKDATTLCVWVKELAVLQPAEVPG